MSPCRVLLAALLAGSAAAQDALELTLSDGRRLAGRLRPVPHLLVLETPLLDAYLSPRAVRSRAPVAAPAEPPAYELNGARLSGPKRGRIGPVVKNMKWGRWAADGTVPVTLEDFELGALSLTLAVSRISPTSIRLDGIEYRKTIEYGTRLFDGLIHDLIAPQIDARDPSSLVKAAQFYALYGDLPRAHGHLAALEALAPGDPRLAAERERLERLELNAALDEAARLAWLDRHREAHALLAPLRCSFVAAQADPALAESLDASQQTLASQVATLERARRWLGDKVSVPELRLDQAEVLTKLLALDEAGQSAATVPAPELPALLAPWASALEPGDLDPNRLRAASELARDTAELFFTADRSMLQGLAQRYAASGLSRALRLAILGRARRYAEPDRSAAWRRVAFDYPPRAPTANRTPAFHYYVQVPSSYRPGRPTPVLISLHGQTATAESQRGFWGALAERHGLVLISPEYIYGRAWAYKYSAEEHHAILGALFHAAGELSLDMDRVYLQGASQGGHTSWDLGATQSGRFAGVLPLIGCCQTADHLPGYLNTAVYCVDGSDDGAAPAVNRKVIEALAELGADARYLEYRGRGHDPFTEEYESMVRWMRHRRRPTAPAQVWLRALRTTDTRARWLEVDTRHLSRAWTPGVRFAALTGSFDRQTQRFSLTANTGASRAFVLIDPALVDLDRPVEVELGGRVQPLGRVAIDWRFALESCLSRRDGQELFVARFSVPLPAPPAAR